MPRFFKTLVSIIAWVLFIFGAASLIGGFGRIIGGSPAIDMLTAYFGFGVGSLFLSVVTMKLRQTMEQNRIATLASNISGLSVGGSNPAAATFVIIKLLCFVF